MLIITVSALVCSLIYPYMHIVDILTMYLHVFPFIDGSVSAAVHGGVLLLYPARGGQGRRGRHYFSHDGSIYGFASHTYM